MYVHKKYKPSSRIKRRSQIRKQIVLGAKIILPFFILVVGIFIMRADFFQIKNVEVMGSNQSEEIKHTATAMLAGNKLFVFPRSNTLLISKKTIEKNILKSFPKVQDANITYSMGGVLEISVTEREGEMLWCNGADCYFMSKSGLVFAKASSEDFGDKIKFEGSIMGDPILQKFAENNMQNYLDAISAINSTLKVEKVTEEMPNKAIFMTPSGMIILNPEENMSEAAKNALLLISEIKNKDANATLEYVDARYGKKMFYKIEGKPENN